MNNTYEFSKHTKKAWKERHEIDIIQRNKRFRETTSFASLLGDDRGHSAKGWIERERERVTRIRGCDRDGDCRKSQLTHTHSCMPSLFR